MSAGAEEGLALGFVAEGREGGGELGAADCCCPLLCWVALVLPAPEELDEVFVCCALPPAERFVGCCVEVALDVAVCCVGAF